MRTARVDAAAGLSMDDKLKIRCPTWPQVFREKANKVRDGVQSKCPQCCKLLTLNRDTDDPFFRRALKAARQIRAAAQAPAFEKAYGPKPVPAEVEEETAQEPARQSVPTRTANQGRA